MPPNSSGPDYREAILNNELNNERILIETFEESVDRHTGGQIDRQTIDDHWLTYERAGLRWAKQKDWNTKTSLLDI